ncbi:hypothetical protein AB0O64_14425 [Streptomyces sp. NPDC088341]|uniref:hypothetical protein n=1 Tax=Streptomyces sp. NPDC088341 TaxID=3154870 RepID=UPI0034455347
MELTPGQEEADRRIFETLAIHGWERSSAGRAFELAHMVFRNRNARLLVEHVWREAIIEISVTTLDGAEGERGIVVYGGNIETVLNLLTSGQDSLAVINFRSLLEEFSNAGLKSYLLHGDDLTEIVATDRDG